MSAHTARDSPALSSRLTSRYSPSASVSRTSSGDTNVNIQAPLSRHCVGRVERRADRKRRASGRIRALGKLDRADRPTPLAALDRRDKYERTLRQIERVEIDNRRRERPSRFAARDDIVVDTRGGKVSALDLADDALDGPCPLARHALWCHRPIIRRVPLTRDTDRARRAHIDRPVEIRESGKEIRRF